MSDFELGERLALEWVQSQIEEMLKRGIITPVEIKVIDDRICRRIDKIWSENGL